MLQYAPAVNVGGSYPLVTDARVWAHKICTSNVRVTHRRGADATHSLKKAFAI